MFNLSIKVWDNYRKEFLFWRKIATKSSAYYAFVNEANTYHTGWSAVEHTRRYTLSFGLGQKDKNGVFLFSGDKVKREDGEVGVIEWVKNHARFAVKCSDKFMLVPTSRVEKVGDIFSVRK